MPSKKELQTLIKDDDLSIRFVPKKENAESSECWNSFHHIFVHNVQQQFVSYNTCKELFMYSSLNGTNTLRSHVNPLNVSKKTKTNIIEACTEFCALDGRAFDVTRGVGFQNLVKILVEISKSISRLHSHKQQKLPRKLQNYSETRFAGAIIMLDIFREMYQNLPEVLINSNAMENYNAIEKDLLDDICNLLEPFQDVINDLSKDRQPCRHQIASNVLQNNNASHSQTSTIATTPKRKSLLTQCFDSKLTNRPQSSNSYQEIENY
ncbi:unnamed protein product [Rotaria socialis]